MRANSRYVEIAPESLKEDQPGFYDQLEANGKLETFLAKRAKAAFEQASSTHDRNLAAGLPPGTSWAESENQAIRDNLLFPSQEEQESERDGYHDQSDTQLVESRKPFTEASKGNPKMSPAEFKAFAKRLTAAFVSNLNANVLRKDPSEKD